MRRVTTLAIVLLPGSFAAAQTPSLAPSTESAMSQLPQSASERLMIADWIGVEVTGPSGNPVGTGPEPCGGARWQARRGGAGVADGSRVAAPYEILKVSAAFEALDLSLPIEAGALVADEAVKQLSSSLDL